MTQWQVFWNQLITKGAWHEVLRGLRATVLIAVIGLLIGTVLGTVIALIKVMPRYRRSVRVLARVCDLYVGLFRGTPMVVQLLIGYWVLIPALGIVVSDATWVAAVIFGLNSGAYVSEMMRAGIRSVDPGQLEAGRALGLPYRTAMIRIVIPQSVKNILPTLGNEFIALIKETSVVSMIAVVDLTRAFENIGAAKYQYVIPYLMLALIYLVMVLGISGLVKLLEGRMNRNERHA